MTPCDIKDTGSVHICDKMVTYVDVLDLHVAMRFVCHSDASLIGINKYVRGVRKLDSKRDNNLRKERHLVRLYV